jgi:hypothetical protein
LGVVPVERRNIEAEAQSDVRGPQQDGVSASETDATAGENQKGHGRRPLFHDVFAPSLLARAKHLSVAAAWDRG